MISVTPTSLLAAWEKVLLFRLGENDQVDESQLPSSAAFPSKFPGNDHLAQDLLGEVLGIATLKLYRLRAMGGRDTSSRGADDFILDLALSRRHLDLHQLCVLGRVVEIAVKAPEHLYALSARIDALTNDDLHRMAMYAVRGIAIAPNVFEGLD